MKNRIAIFTNGYSNEFIQHVLGGIQKKAKEDGIDIFPHWWFDLDDKDTVIPLFEWFEKVER